MNLKKLLGMRAQAAQLSSYRGEVLDNNIANSETPNYKARDVDFKSILKQSSGVSQANLSVCNKAHIGAASQAKHANELLYRVPSQPSLDGNTVDMDREKAEFSNNAMSYQVSMTFLGGKVKGIMSALRGE